MKPDSRDDAAALMVLAVVVLIFLGVIGWAAAFLRYGDSAGM